MNLSSPADIRKIISKTHFAIIDLPAGYGVGEIRPYLTGKNTVFMEPKIHDKQKNEIINVDDIAELERVTRSKQTGGLTIVLLHAEKINEQAQNKFLKLLEEPGDNIHFVFVAEGMGNFMATVLSRAQVFHVKKLSRTESLSLVKATAPKLDPRTVQQIMFLASGLPGEIKHLCQDPKYLQQESELVNIAKTIITGKEYDIIKVAYALKDDRARAIEAIDLAVIIAKELLKKNTLFLAKLDQLDRAKTGLLQNGNVRLSIIGNLIGA